MFYIPFPSCPIDRLVQLLWWVQTGLVIGLRVGTCIARDEFRDPESNLPIVGRDFSDSIVLGFL